MVDSSADDRNKHTAIVPAIDYTLGRLLSSPIRYQRSSLHTRGRLLVERIAGKDYTTLANIERMRELRLKLIPATHVRGAFI